MKHKTKLLALLLAVVMIFTATALISCTSEDLTSAHPKETVVTFSDTLNSEPQSSPYISLSASPVTVSVTEKATTLTQTLTATIIPVTAANKEVDWSVAWADTANTSNPSDYLGDLLGDQLFQVDFVHRLADGFFKVIMTDGALDLIPNVILDTHG